MLEAIEKLLALQDRDQKLRTLRLEIHSVPTEIASKQKLIADSATRLETARSRAKTIEVEKKIPADRYGSQAGSNRQV